MTYAVIKTGGKQYKAALGEVLTVEKLEGEVGSTITLPVLFAEGGVQVAVIAEIIEHGKGDKVIIFKKKRRHNYRRKNGHRQPLTSIQIIQLGDVKLASDKKRVAKVRTAPVPKIKGPAQAKVTKPVAEKAPAKKATAKKTSDKSAAAKKETSKPAAKKTTKKDAE